MSLVVFERSRSNAAAALGRVDYRHRCIFRGEIDVLMLHVSTVAGDGCIGAIEERRINHTVRQAGPIDVRLVPCVAALVAESELVGADKVSMPCEEVLKRLVRRLTLMHQEPYCQLNGFSVFG